MQPLYILEFNPSVQGLGFLFDHLYIIQTLYFCFVNELLMLCRCNFDLAIIYASIIYMCVCEIWVSRS